jgi:hypothetical protein
LRNPNVIAEIEQRREEYAQLTKITKQRVVDGMLESIDMAKSIAEPATMLKGWTEVGKMHGFYEPQKHEINLNAQHEIRVRQLQQLPDEELMKLAQGETIEGEYSEQ